MKKINSPFEGFAIYAISHNQKICPIGIVTSDGRRLAKCSLDSIPFLLSQSLIQIEDVRFYKHIGIDFRAIIRAATVNLKKGKIIEGGSTITQQLARNIFLTTNRNILRKLKEIFYALFLELKYSKSKILELYFNKIFWGKNLYGIRSASLYYFRKELNQLSKSEQIMLVTLLRGPNFYVHNKSAREKRFNLLNNKLFSDGILKFKEYKKIDKKNIPLQANSLYAFKSTIVPFIKDKINEKEFSIFTTLDKKLQDNLSKTISKAKISLSIIIIIDGKVKAVSSTYGNDYPFTFKSNVGSTLKPFLYSILRKNGIGYEEEISTINLNKNWYIREAVPSKSPSLTLSQALLFSNNNTFVNAAIKIGLPIIYNELSKILPIKSELTPSIILGSSKTGISLYELSLLYNSFFKKNNDLYKIECLDILNKNLFNRLNMNIDEGYFKTGTTNNYKQRFAIFGRQNMTIGFLTEGYRNIDQENYEKDED